MKNIDFFELIVLTFFIHFVIFAFLEIVFVIIFEKLKFKKISIFLDKNFIVIVTILSGIFTILCLYNYFKELN
jgi:hypothetical protein